MTHPTPTDILTAFLLNNPQPFAIPQLAAALVTALAKAGWVVARAANEEENV